MKGKSYEEKHQKNCVLIVCRCFYVRNVFHRNISASAMFREVCQNAKSIAPSR